MSEHERRKRMFAAQGFAAIALFVMAHGAHAATTPAQPVQPAQAAAVGHARAE